MALPQSVKLLADISVEKKTNFGKICGRAIFIFFSRTAKIDEVPPNVSWEMSVKINDRI